MWTTNVTRTTIASPKAIWKLWSDVSNWNTWDADVKTASLQGEFHTGTKGTLQPAGGPASSFIMTECTPLQSFTNRSKLPFCTLDFIHTLQQTDNYIQVTHTVEMKGAMTFLFSKLIGKKLQAGLPQTVDKLIQLAEQNKA